jgi:CRP/FNR family cyclic AMP-dependent transcriptional regulator
VTKKEISLLDNYLPLVRRLFEQSSLTKQVDPRTLGALLGAGQIQRHAAGKVLALRGQPMPEQLFVVEGSLEISMQDPAGQRSILWYLGPGQWLGLISMLDNQGAIHDAQAHSDCVLLQVPNRAFLATMEQDPQLMHSCLQMLCERSRMTYDNLAAETLLPLRARLVRLLLMLLDQHGRDSQDGVELTLKLSQDDLSDMLGVTRQSLNRELKALEKQGIIAIAYSRITLRDVPLLQSMMAVSEGRSAAMK